MTNYHVFDQLHDPIFTHQVNTFEDPGIEAGAEADAAKAGVLFAASFAASVPAGQNLLLQVANPPGSGRTMYVSRVFGSSSAAVTLALYRNGTFTGSAITPVNLNFGSANASAMTAQGGTGTLGGGPAVLLSLIFAGMALYPRYWRQHHRSAGQRADGGGRDRLRQRRRPDPVVGILIVNGGRIMTNYHIFNTASQPLFNLTTNTYQNPYTVSPPEESASRAGSLFSVTASNTGTVGLVLLTVTVSLRLNNPPGSGKTAYISGIYTSIGGSSLLSSLAGSATIVRGGTLSSPATLTPANHNFGSANASVLQAQSSTSAASGGTPFMAMQLAPGAVIHRIAGGIILPPGTSMCVSVVASSSSLGLSITSMASIAWWEA